MSFIIEEIFAMISRETRIKQSDIRETFPGSVWTRESYIRFFHPSVPHIRVLLYVRLTLIYAMAPSAAARSLVVV